MSFYSQYLSYALNQHFHEQRKQWKFQQPVKKCATYSLFHATVNHCNSFANRCHLFKTAPIKPLIKYCRNTKQLVVAPIQSHIHTQRHGTTTQCYVRTERSNVDVTNSVTSISRRGSAKGRGSSVLSSSTASPEGEIRSVRAPTYPNPRLNVWRFPLSLLTQQ